MLAPPYTLLVFATFLTAPEVAAACPAHFSFLTVPEVATACPALTSLGIIDAKNLRETPSASGSAHAPGVALQDHSLGPDGVIGRQHIPVFGQGLRLPKPGEHALYQQQVLWLFKS
eukprot:1158759-Pelagomonas_calceolata.AAC.9